MIHFLIATFLFVSLLHLYNNWRIQRYSLYLSGALIFITYHFVTYYLFIFGSSVFWLAVFFGHGTPLTYLTGPLLFLYVRSVLRDEDRLNRKDLWHFLPAILDLFCRIPYYLEPWSFKMYMAGEIVKDIRHIHDFAFVFFPSSYFSFPARIISMIGYTLYCIWMVSYFNRNYTPQNRIPKQVAKVPIRFLNYLLSIFLITHVSILLLLLMFLNDKSMAFMQVTQSPLLLISFLGILSIPIIIQLHPEVLYGIPRLISDNKMSSVDMPENAKGHTMHSFKDLNHRNPDEDELSAEAQIKFIAMAERIRCTLERDKLYLQPDFSMEDLAKVMDVPKHHLYYCFNHILQKRFTQLRAELRIQYACELILKGENEKKTLEAIGIESGFSTRSSFIMAFKEYTRMTPGQFQRSAGES